MEPVAQRVRDLVSEKLGVARERLRNQDNLAVDLGADSLDVVELFMTLERDFRIRIPDEIFPDLQTVADLTRYVVMRRGPAS